MTFEDFIKQMHVNTAPSSDLPDTLKALWYAKKGCWEKAHTIAKNIKSKNGSWIHANLHREEGDLNNARYWYDKSERPMPSLSVDNERDQLIHAFLN